MSYFVGVVIVDDEEKYRIGFDPYHGNDNSRQIYDARRWKKDKCSYLYVIAAEARFSEDDINACNSLFKVGLSDNPWSRCNELQTGCPHKLYVAKTWRLPARKIAAYYESKAHKILSRRRARREWFIWELDLAIDRLNSMIVEDWWDSVEGHGYLIEFLEYSGMDRDDAHRFIDENYGFGT